jgi:hypothetical protein
MLYCSTNCSVGEPAEGSLPSANPPVKRGVTSRPLLGTPSSRMGVVFRPFCFGGVTRRNNLKIFLSQTVQSENFLKSEKTFNNGSLGSGIDEERSEMR